MAYRTAFVTGASSGIGRALSLRLAEQGLEVALSARREGALEDLAREIRAAGGRARVYPLDVRRADEVYQTVQQADDDLGGLDIVVANAGVNDRAWAGSLGWKHMENTLAVNVAGAAATLTAVLPRMVRRKQGHLVGISSLAQYRGLPGNAVYSASKAFLSTFLEGVRVDVRSQNVRVTDVRPGFVQTAMVDGVKHRMPLLMQPDDAAAAIWRGIDRGDPVVAFPWPLATAVRSARLLPPAWWDRAVTRARGSVLSSAATSGH